MDWQELASLLIVALTLAAFAGRALRRRRGVGLPCGSHCGCASTSRPPAILYSARKGSSAQVHVGFRP